MDYINYTAEELVLDDYFRKWVNGVLPKEDTFWENWEAGHPEKAAMISQAKFVIRALEMEHVSINDERLTEKIRQIIDITEEKTLWNSGWKLSWWQWAAAAVVIFGLGWFYISPKIIPQSNYEEMVSGQIHPGIEKVNNSHEPMKIGLSDGSVITLQPNSKLNYPETFAADKREVYLSGEGFFDIAKNPDKPFLVYANEIVTKVLGTSFSIKAYDKDLDVVVKVVTGKVSVLSRKSGNDEEAVSKPEGLILYPNQMAVYSRAPEKLTRTLIDNPVLIKTSKKVSSDFNFDATPITTVFETLEKGYGVTIVYDTEVLKNCTITAPLENETLYEKLDLICKVIRASYEVVDAQVVITSRGCE